MMTIAIRRSNGNMLWFDAVLSYDRSLTGIVTKHPIQTGSNITDHTVIENEVISLYGVWSDADFNLSRPSIDPQQGELWGIANKQFVNNTPSQGEVRLDGDRTFPVFPEIIGQFVKTDAPEVVMPSPSFKIRPADSLKREVMEVFDNKEEFALVDFQNGKISEVLNNCVMVGLKFSETPESGDAVYPVMDIERVKWAYVSEVDIKTKKVEKKVEKKTAAPKACGTQPANPQSTPTSSKLPPAPATQYSTTPAVDILGGTK